MADPEPPADLRIHKVSRAPSNPLDKLWNKAPARRLDAAPQRVTLPHGHDPAATVEVRGVHDEEYVSFRVGWAAPTAEPRVGINQYRDSCALMFPALDGDLPPVTMGAPANPVVVWQWKPDWEDPASQEEWRKNRYREYADFYDPSNESLFGAVGDRPRGHAANVLVAEGFGSLTRTEDPDLNVSSHHTGQEWRVVFRHRLPAQYPLLGVGQSSALTAAVWDGSKHERGSRKNLSYQWHSYRLEGQGPPSTPGWTTPGALAAGATAASIAWIIRRRIRLAHQEEKRPPGRSP